MMTEDEHRAYIEAKRLIEIYREEAERLQIDVTALTVIVLLEAVLVIIVALMR